LEKLDHVFSIKLRDGAEPCAVTVPRRVSAAAAWVGENDWPQSHQKGWSPDWLVLSMCSSFKKQADSIWLCIDYTQL